MSASIAVKNMKLKKIPEINPTTAYKKAKEGTLFVDVREKDELLQSAFDVPNIINIPLSEIEQRYTELSKEQDLVLVCRGGVRSMRAAWFLLEHGFTKMKNMKHGIIGWTKDGFPVQSSVPQVDSNCLCSCSSNNSDSCCQPK